MEIEFIFIKATANMIIMKLEVKEREKKQTKNKNTKKDEKRLKIALRMHTNCLLKTQTSGRETVAQK